MLAQLVSVVQGPLPSSRRQYMCRVDHQNPTHTLVLGLQVQLL